MGIAVSLREYLDDHHINYEVMTHEPTGSSLQTAQASHVPGDCLAKGVILTREGGCVLAVVPASSKVRLDAIEQMLHCPVGLASEDEVSSLFPDCEAGAVPPIGAAYAVDTIIDESLDHQRDLYMEGGDHRSLIHMPRMEFQNLMKDVPHGHIATPEVAVKSASPRPSGVLKELAFACWRGSEPQVSRSPRRGINENQ